MLHLRTQYSYTWYKTIHLLETIGWFEAAPMSFPYPPGINHASVSAAAPLGNDATIPCVVAAAATE